MIPDIIGRPWKEAEEMLRGEGLSYEEERTFPSRNFFSIDEDLLYVVRARKGEDGIFHIVLAARMRKEVS